LRELKPVIVNLVFKDGRDTDSNLIQLVLLPKMQRILTLWSNFSFGRLLFAFPIVQSLIIYRFLQSEVKSPRLSGMRAFNAVAQSLSIDLLQAVVARGETDQLALETIEAAVIGKLYFSVHADRLDLQNKLLHLLHSVISALTAIGPTPLVAHHARIDGLSEISNAPEVGQASASHPYNVNPLLIQTLIDGIGTSANRPLLQHWLDFILMTVPQFHHALQPVVAPLIDCICRQLRSAMTEVVGAQSLMDDSEDIRSSTTDAELTMFLHAVERLLLLSLSKPSDPSEIEDENSFPEKQAGHDGSGILGYVSTVFSSEAAANIPEDQLTVSAACFTSALTEYANTGTINRVPLSAWRC
jgi:hypothetical protein